VGRGCPLPTGGGVWGGGFPKNFFEFVSENGEFWCILSGILAGVCSYIQESQEMNREEIKKERETITLLKADIQTLVELNSPNSVGLHVFILCLKVSY